ncbi:MAG: hypothetical protein DRN95_05400, partial [Candidatus Hydrothermarchaeota archaeon]
MEEASKILYYGRKKLLSLIVITIINFAIAWYYCDRIIERIKQDMLPEQAKLIVTTPMEYLLVKIQVSLILAVLITLIIFIFYLLRKYRVRIIWIPPA